MKKSLQVLVFTICVLLASLTASSQVVLIAGQDFETSPATPTWSYTASSGAASTTNTGTPADRIKGGSRSFQETSTALVSMEFTGVANTTHSGRTISIWNAMISSTTGNGIDAGATDFLNVYVSNSNVKPASPLVIVNAAAANVRWGMSGTGTINATAGGSQVTYSYPAGGTITGTNAKSNILIAVPDAWTDVYLWIDFDDDQANEIWCIDDVELKGTVIPGGCVGPTVSSTTSTANITTTLADLTGNVTAVGGGTAVTTRGFDYSTSSVLAAPTTVSASPAAPGTGSYTLTTGVLASNTRYFYRAFGINDCTSPQTAYSHTSGFPSFYTRPDAPVASTPTNATSSGFDVSWNNVSGGETETYLLEVSTTNFGTPVLSVNVGAVTSYTINSGLSPSTQYYYRVTAVNAGQSSAVSNVAGPITTLVGPCGSESFTNSNLTASYAASSFTGDNGVTWSYVESRDESTFGITGKGIILRNLSGGSKVTSSSVAGGIEDFTCSLRKAFTGAGNRQVELFVNGVSRGTSIAWDNTSVQTFTVTGINITGNVIVEIRNITGNQVIVDDISWTCKAQCTTAAVASTSNTPVVCFGDGQGSITVTGSGSATPYTYSIDNGSNYQSSNSFTSLLPGSYNIKVKGNDGCESAATPVTVGGPTSVLSFTYSQSNVTTTGGNDGSITVIASGGTSGYTYSIDNGSNYQAGNSFTALSAATYPVKVKDANNCETAAQSVVIIEDIPTIVTSILIPNFICPGSTVSVPYTITGSFLGTNTFTAQLSDATGSFTAPTPIGNLTNTNTSGTISATIPANTPVGTGYRIRVVGSAPTIIGSNNGVNITIQFNNVTPVFIETMGTSVALGGTATIASYETANNFDNDAFTMSNTGFAELRNNSSSSVGYQDASGSAHVALPVGGTSGFRIDGINTSGFSPLALNFGICKTTTTDNGTGLRLEISTNSGSSWTTVPLGAFLPTGTGTGDGKWYLIKLAGAIPQSSTVSIRFTNLNATGATYRIDDVSVFSGTATSASISPASPPAQCSGTIPLTASPANADYLWSNAALTQVTAANATGSYTVTVTDRFGCSASAGPVNVTIDTPVTASVSISPTTACAGNNNTFTATPVNGGGSPSYTWKVNGSSVGTGSTLVNPTLVEGDVISCEMVSSATCFVPATAVSNLVTAQKLAYSPTVAWTETFGTTGSTAIAGYGGYTNGQGLAFSGSPSGYPEVRTTQSSPTGSGASGGSNMYFATIGTAGGPVVLDISGINTTAAFPNILSFWAWNDGFVLSGSSSFKVSYSTDGITYYPLSYGPTSGTLGWYQITINNALPYASNVRLRFTQSASIQARIDDLTLTKYTTGDASITGPASFCSGNVTLNALPNAAGLTYAWSDLSSGTSTTVSSATTTNLTITDIFGCTSSASKVTTVDCNYTWSGTTTQWSQPTNWTPNGVPNDCAHNVTIPNGLTVYPLIGLAAFTVGNLTIEEGATLTINVGSGTGGLKVCGDVTAGTTTNANIIGTSTRGLILEGSANQKISGLLNIDRLRLNNSAGATLQAGANVSVNKAVELQSGTLAINGQTMTFKSTSSTNYAILDNFTSGYTGTLTGNATAERYVPVTGINQHYLGSPVTGTTFAQLGASGTPGFVIPKPNCDQLNVANNSPYGNIFQWHDNVPANATCLYNGWEVKTAGTAQTGKGYSVYLPNGTFAITGPLNQANTYSVSGLDNIGWESNTLQTVGTIPAVYKSGWHIVSNPFLAPIELSGHSADFSSAAVWVTSGAFAGSYQPVAITGGQIAPFQGFIVRRSSASAATFTFDKSECRTTTGIPFYKTASEHQLSLQVSGNGFNDITRVEFNAATTNAFDVDYDAFKPMSALGQPTISSFNTDITERLAINVNKDIAETPNVQLNFVPGNNGTFTFTVDGINTFDPTSYVTLEDTKEGTMTDLRQNPIYTFTGNKTDNHNRFILHFTPAAAITTTNGTCTENGTLSVTQDGPADWNYTITSTTDTTTIAAGTLNSTNAINQTVPMGTYQITLTDNSGYQVIKNVQVNGQTPIAAASMTASTTTIEEDQTITLTNTTTNTTTNNWNFGDGTTATTATADHTYTTPGIYTVTLTVTNADGCQSTTTQTITVTEKLNTSITTTTKESINIYPNPASTKLNINISKVTAETKLTLTNALGQTIQTQDKLKQGVNTLDVSQLAEGLYLITISEGKAVLTTQRIVISQ